MVQRTPQNKMVGNQDEETKTAPLRDEAAESRQPNRYWYPTLGVSIEADSQGEADEKAMQIIREREGNK